jgi:hypothetical protein
MQIAGAIVLLLFVMFVVLTIAFWGFMSWVVVALYVFVAFLAALLGVGFGLYLVIRRRKL